MDKVKKLQILTVIVLIVGIVILGIAKQFGMIVTLIVGLPVFTLISHLREKIAEARKSQ